MIKHIEINSQTIPVPIPIKSLEELVNWLNEFIVKKSQAITKIEVNDQDVTDELEDLSSSNQSLAGDDQVSVKVDSASDLVLDSMDAITDFSKSVLEGIKGNAVGLWQYGGKVIPEEIHQLSEDLHTMIELYENVSYMTDISAGEVAAFEGLNRLIRRATNSFDDNIKLALWQKSSRILLNQLEPLIKDLIEETELLQIRISADSDALVNVRM